MLNPLTHRKILKKGLPGTANVVTRGVYSPNASTFNLAMTLQVYVEGITPYEVEDNWMVKAKDTVALGGAIPVRVDPDDHQRVSPPPPPTTRWASSSAWLRCGPAAPSPRRSSRSRSAGSSNRAFHQTAEKRA